VTYRFEPAAETMPRPQLEALQLQRLRQTAQNAFDNVPLHRQRMQSAGLEPGVGAGGCAG